MIVTIKTKSAFIPLALFMLTLLVSPVRGQETQNSISPEAQALSHAKEGLRLVKENKFADAVLEFKRAVELNPNSADYHLSLGFSLHELKRYVEAEVEKRAAVKLAPTKAFYHSQLGLTLHEMKKYDQAEAERREAVRLEPNNARYRTWRFRFINKENTLRRKTNV